jgi:class 3 adenylate cyclase/HAMP domain-containing protein
MLARHASRCKFAYEACIYWTNAIRVVCPDRLHSMPQIVFSVAEPRILVLAVLCASITAYFLSLPGKMRDLRFLIGAFLCWTAHFTVALIREIFYPLPAWFAVSEMCIGLAGLVLFIGFAFHFRLDVRPRSFAFGFTSACMLAAVCTGILVVQADRNQPIVWSLGSGTAVILFLAAELIFVYRWIISRHSEDSRPYRSFALLFLLSVAAVLVYFLRDIGLCPSQVAAVLSSILYLATLVGFTLAYVNHASNPTSFRVKIVGAALTAVLALLMVTWTAVAPVSEHGLALAHDLGSMPAGITGNEFTIEQIQLMNSPDVQRKIISCNYCIIGATLFVLIFFPVFFRLSLVEPLNALLRAVDQVDAGFLDVEVPVRYNDEIGRLTINFNRMTRSLKAAEADIKCYMGSLEAKVEERTIELARKNAENERLLLNILPPSIADRLKKGEPIIADACTEATILFADIVGFTQLSCSIPATELVSLLSGLISDFDRLTKEHGVEKIKTIGDAYMAVAGLPEARADHAQAAIRLALDMLKLANKRTTRAGDSLQLRIGINSGPVIAGVIGTHKFAYDLWGDAVNTASRMESCGEPGRIQVTEATYTILKELYRFTPRGQIEVKGKGLMPTYFLVEDDAQAFPISKACAC